MARQLSSNQLKLLAVVAMFLDHFFAIFVDHDTEIGMALRVIGRIVAPIMCYLIAEGFEKTSDVNRYLKRLFLFALISHIPYNLAFGYSFFQATGVMWGLFLGLFALKITKSEVHPLLKLLAVCLCCLLSIRANWNYVTVLWIVGFGLFSGNKRKQILIFCLISICAHLVPTFLNFGFAHEGYPHWYQLGVFLSIPLLLRYSGERGEEIVKMGRYGFYMFYPAHLLFLYCLDALTPLKDILLEVIR